MNEWPRRRSRYKWPPSYTLLKIEYWGFLGSSVGKESACNAGDPGSIPGLGRIPGEGIGYPLQYYCLENSHGQRALVGFTALQSQTRLSN